MKNFYIALALILFCNIAMAQDNQPQAGEKKSKEIEALKVAFISKELELSPDEAQKFWPLFNQYSNEIKFVVKNSPDPLDKDEKVLNIKKHYKDQFVKIIGTERTNQLYTIEGKFRQLLIKTLRKQNNMQENQDRPMLQRRRQLRGF